MAELKKTPFYEKEIESGGKIIDFGGWALPVQYEGILKEHKMVREKSGLFDVSHMGEILIKGEKARSHCNDDRYVGAWDHEQAIRRGIPI